MMQNKSGQHDNKHNNNVKEKGAMGARAGKEIKQVI